MSHVSKISLPRAAPSRLVVAVAQKLLLHGLQALLDSEYEIVATTQDGGELVAEVVTHRPSLVLMGVDLGGINGFEAAVEIREKVPETRIVFLCASPDATTVHNVFQSGAKGFLLTQCSGEELLFGLREVLGDRRYFTPELKMAPLDRGKQQDDRTDAISAHSLTKRELEVLQMVASGHPARVISQVLSISLKTVAFHKQNLRQKLSLRSSAEIATFAITNGFLVPSGRLMKKSLTV